MSKSEDEEEELFPWNPVQENLIFDYQEIPMNSIIAAVYKNNLKEVKRQVECGKSVNCNDNRGYTPLHAAAEKGNTAILNYLLKQPDININCQNHSGETPLYLSIRYKNIVSAKKLIKAGADIRKPDTQRVTPLHLAARTCCDIAVLLIRKGAEVNAVDFDLDTPLHEAVRVADTEMISLLIYHGANANMVNDNGCTPFMLSLTYPNSEVQKVLFDLEADFNRIAIDGFSTLLLAINSKSPFICAIIDRGADVNYSVEDICPLEQCLHCDDYEVFRKIWDKYKYNKDVSEDVSLYFLLFNTYLSPYTWRMCLETLLLSQHISKILDHACAVNAIQVLTLLILGFSVHKYPESELFPCICIVLSHGVEVYFENVETAYNCYGYNKVVHLLLHMSVIMHPVNNVTFPFLLCDIYGTGSSLKGCKFLEGGCFKAEPVSKLLYFCTPSEELKQQFFNLQLLNEQESVSQSFQRVKQRLMSLSVPSLKEISRNAARKSVGVAFNVQSTSRFYSIIERLNVPESIKDILTYKMAVNRFN